MEHVALNGKTYVMVVETGDDACHKCPFHDQMVNGKLNMTQDCINIGEVCIDQGANNHVYFTEKL